MAKGLDSLALPLKEPVRASRGLTSHYSFRNLMQELCVGILTDLMTALLDFYTTDTHLNVSGFFFHTTGPIWKTNKQNKQKKPHPTKKKPYQKESPPNQTNGNKK